MSEKYGYIRVSSKDQNEERQLIALKQYGIPPKNLYMDKQSGRNFNRPAYKRLVRKLKPNDLLIVKSIDRLGRSYEEIIEQWKIITKERSSDICVIDMPLLDTRRDKDLLGTFISDLVLQILSFVSQTEREYIHQRQAEGIAAAKQRGVQFGRPAAKIDEKALKIIEEWQQRLYTADHAAQLLQISRRTFFNYVKKCSK